MPTYESHVVQRNARTCKTEVAVDFVVTFAFFELENQTRCTHQKTKTVQYNGRHIPDINGAVWHLALGLHCHQTSGKN